METSKLKKFWAEFKAFAMRGNVLDMAVGVVIGSAFTAIVNSLVGDIISPVIGLFFNADFSRVGHHHRGRDHWVGCVSECGHQLFDRGICAVCGAEGVQRAAQKASPGGSFYKALPLLSVHHLHQGGALPALYLQAGGLAGSSRLRQGSFSKPKAAPAAQRSRGRFLPFSRGETGAYTWFCWIHWLTCWAMA